VAVNGRYIGIFWKTPFKADITSALKPGSNQLVIGVTNLWVNRLIGDQQSYAVRKYTFTDFTPYKADSPLLPSDFWGRCASSPTHRTNLRENKMAASRRRGAAIFSSAQITARLAIQCPSRP